MLPAITATGPAKIAATTQRAPTRPGKNSAALMGTKITAPRSPMDR